MSDNDIKRVYVRSDKNRYEEVEWIEEFEKGCFDGIIGLLYSNGILKIQFAQN